MTPIFVSTCRVSRRCVSARFGAQYVNEEEHALTNRPLIHMLPLAFAESDSTLELKAITSWPYQVKHPLCNTTNCVIVIALACWILDVTWRDSFSEFPVWSIFWCDARMKRTTLQKVNNITSLFSPQVVFM